MAESEITGSCLCKKVRYAIEGNLGIFQYCHCSRCRKFTGSAFSANLMVSPAKFRWLKGEEFVGRHALRRCQALRHVILPKLRIVPAVAGAKRKGHGHSGRYTR